MKNLHQISSFRAIVCLLLFASARTAVVVGQPANNQPCGAITIPLAPASPFGENCVPTTVYSWTGATDKGLGASGLICQLFAGAKEIYYKYTVPASGDFVVSMAATDDNYNPGFLQGYQFALFAADKCANPGASSYYCTRYIESGPNNFPSVVIRGRTPGATEYLAIWRQGGLADGSVKLCIAEVPKIAPANERAGIGISNPRSNLDVNGQGHVQGNLTVMGRVGIGTSDPQYALDVYGRMRIRGSTNSGFETPGIWLGKTGSTGWVGFIGAQSNTHFGFYEGTSNGGWGLTYNATNGRVGIGTSTQAERLEVVEGPSAAPTTLVIGNRGGFGPAAIAFVSDYGLANQWRPGYIRSADLGGFTGALEFFTNGTGGANLYGLVKGLEVRNGATLTATGSVGSFSDERIKHNIRPFTDGLNVLEQIHPIQFQYRPDAPFQTSQQQVGIVAQELEKAAPFMVHRSSQNGYEDLRWVDNQAYTFMLINAVKELSARLESQQRELDKLKSEPKSGRRRLK